MVWGGEGRNTGIVFDLTPSIQVSLCTNQAAKRLRLWYLDNSITSNRVDSIVSKTSSIHDPLFLAVLSLTPLQCSSGERLKNFHLLLSRLYNVQ